VLKSSDLRELLFLLLFLSFPLILHTLSVPNYTILILKLFSSNLVYTIILKGRFTLLSLAVWRKSRVFGESVSLFYTFYATHVSIFNFDSFKKPHSFSFSNYKTFRYLIFFISKTLEYNLAPYIFGNLSYFFILKYFPGPCLTWARSETLLQ